MLHTLIRRFLTCAVLCGSPLAATEASAFEGAVLYEDANFGGSQLVLYPGEGITHLDSEWRDLFRTWNDHVSSVGIWGEVVVYLYEHANYGGRVIALTEHTAGLSGWNDRASSVYVDYYYAEGWMYDSSMESWVYWEGDWFYHDRGLGWLYGGHYDRTYGTGWLYDFHFGWLYMDHRYYPWFYSSSWGYLMFLPETYAPRWWYSDYYGWITG